MTERVFVSIKGLQFGEAEPIEARYHGRYGKINGKHCISYEDRLTDGEPVTKNLIKVAGNQVTIIKKNGVESRLVFDPKMITSSVYHTPYGSITMSIVTRSVSIKDEPGLFELNLEYSLFSGDTLISDNKVNVKVTPKKQAG